MTSGGRVRATAPPDDAIAARYRADGHWSTAPTDHVRAVAAADGARVAVTDRDGSLSYAEWDRRADACRDGLVGDGVGPGDAVLLVADNSVDAMVAFVGGQRLGAVVVALPVSAGSADVAFALERTAARRAIGPRARLEALAAAHPTARWSGPLDGSGGGDGPRDPDAPAVVVFTSGTTAHPKGVIHSPNTLAVAARNYVAAAHLVADERFFLVSPLASITGMLQALVMAPMLGATVVLERAWDDDRSLDRLVSQGGTFYGGPDVILARLFDAALRRGIADLPLRAVSVGGTMLDRSLLRRAEEVHGIRVMRAYGSSEAPFSTATPYDAPAGDRQARDGIVLDGVELRIGTVHDPGECAIRGPHLFLGYLDAADNRSAFDDAGWYCTGDVGSLDDGQLLITGRIKDIVIRNGLKVSMSEVEQAVAALDGVGECAAYRVTDGRTGERLGIAVRATDPVELEAIVARLTAGGLARWKLPEELVRWTGPFPMTATGKVQRDAVAAAAAGLTRQVNARLAADDPAADARASEALP